MIKPLAWPTLALGALLLVWAMAVLPGGRAQAGTGQALGAVQVEPAFPSLSFGQLTHLANAGDGTGRL